MLFRSGAFLWGLAMPRSEALQHWLTLRLETVVMRLLLPLSLSYDHRVINGADGARFTTKLAGLLSDPIELLIEG